VTAFKRAKPAAYGADRTITASAARVNLKDTVEGAKHRQRVTVSQVWQDEAWIYYDEIGEIKYAYNLFASIASRLRLYVGVVVDPDAPPVPVRDATATEEDETESVADDAADARNQRSVDPELAKEADEIFRKEMRGAKVPQIMRSFVLNLKVPGECYLIRSTEGAAWRASSTSEVKIATGDKKFQVQRSVAEGNAQNFLPDDAVVGRVWQEHPRYSMDPDSALLGIRNDCEELLLISRMIRAITRSKLNAGMVYVPDEISVVSRTEDPDDDGVASEEEADPFETELLYTMTEPVNSEQSAAGLVPMLARGPAELGEKIRHILFERKSDEFIVARAASVLDRILTSIDVPKDVVNGLANVKYSNAIQIDENMYKAHVEPFALVACDAFTDIVLHPALRKAGMDSDSIEQFVVWYDPSEVVVRPNRSDDADKGYDKGLLSGAAWRDAHGFSDTDAPGEDELAFRLAFDKAVVPPELATVLFNAVLPELTKAARAGVADGRIPPDLEEALGNDIAMSPVPEDPNAAPVPGEVPVEEEPLPPAAEESPLPEEEVVP
jgi:hypothetical protein